MAQQPDITNAALMKIAASLVSDITENSEQARKANAVFSRVARRELRSHAWSFALARGSAALLPDTPAFGYSYAYALPADCLRLVYVNGLYADYSLRGAGDDITPPYAIEGRSLLTDLGAPVLLRYVKDVSSNLSIWDACFEEAFACALAVELAIPLTKNIKLWEKAKAEYKDAIFQAKRCNAIELPSVDRMDSSWMTARR